MTLNALWGDAEKRVGSKVAVISNGKRFTYGEIGSRIRSFSARLASNWRISPGEIVALLSPNSVECVMAYFAVVGMGAIIQPIDERLNAGEIRRLLNDSGVRFLIIHGSLWKVIEQVRAEIPRLEGIVGIGLPCKDVHAFEEWSMGNPMAMAGSPKPADAAELMYTSGTSGEPKGVIRSHGNVRAACRNARVGFGYRPEDVIAIVMPLSHSSALTSQMLPLIEQGGTIFLIDRFDSKELISVMQAEQVTCMRVVPAMLRLLLAHAQFSCKHVPSLRLLVNSSAAINIQTLREVKERFPSVQVMNSYGLTEASTCTMIADDAALARPNSVGRPIEGVDLCIMGDNGTQLSDDMEGEIGVRGDHVFVGYRNRPEETDAAFRNGWFLTGDVGHRDQEGYYYLHGRKQEVINCAGRKFSPLDVETCILELPGVAEAAVIGVPHRVLGQVAKAFVVPEQGHRPVVKEIVNHCVRNLPSYKVPFFVEVVLELPRSGIGKVLRRKLK